MKLYLVLFAAAYTWATAAWGESVKHIPSKHLFILAGQSNMEKLRPQASFIPALRRAFGADRILVVKETDPDRAIHGWVKDGPAIPGLLPGKQGDVYERLMREVKKATRKTHIPTVTFVWMHGEHDAREGHGDIYRESLEKLVTQLQADLDRRDINWIMGRLSDHDLQNQHAPDWSRIREIQTAFVQNHPRAVLVNTDDLNDSLDYHGNEIRNDIHLSNQGCTILGQRFADAAIEMIRKQSGSGSSRVTLPERPALLFSPVSSRYRPALPNP